MLNDFSVIDLRVTHLPAIADGQVIRRWRVEAISVFFRLRTLLKLRSRIRLTFNHKISTTPVQLVIKEISPEATPESLKVIPSHRLERTSGNRVMFGPWTGELGMEIFYWAPWVQSVASEDDLVMSRGGTKFLYPKSSSYIDIFTHTNAEWWGNYQVDQVRIYGGEKQRVWLAHELDLIKELQEFGMLNPRERVVHPKEFFKRFYADSSRDEEMILNFVESLSTHLPKTIESHLSQLNTSKSNLFNGHQVAYGVYSREGVNSAHVSEFLKSSRVREVIDHSEIYSLRTSYSDKHHLQIGEPEGMSYPLLNSRRDENLLNQASLISNCQYLITTHGGLAYLGLLLGRNVIALQSSMNVWHPRHVKNAELLAKLQDVKFEVIVC